MAYEFIASPNYTSGRRGYTVELVIIHYTASLNIAGTLAWFQDTKSQVSSHYLIGRDGRTIQLVAEEHTAWHAGRTALWQNRSFVNSRSLGIELVGTADSGFTHVQMAALNLLLAEIVARYAIPPTAIVGHSTVAPGLKIDPEGYTDQFAWDDVRTSAHMVYAALP